MAKKKVQKKTSRKVTKKPAKKLAKKAAKKVVKRVPPRIVKKVVVVAKSEEEYKPIDQAKAVAFAMSIAQEMKKSAAKADLARAEQEIRLTRRPTTRSQGKSTVKFPANDLREFKRRLLDARQAALSGASAMRATGFNGADDHEADGGDGTNQTCVCRRSVRSAASIARFRRSTRRCIALRTDPTASARRAVS